MAATVGKMENVPAGSVVSFQIEGKQVAVANVDGQLFAFDDACTHLGCSLAKGSLERTSITCPCHGSVFQVTDGSVTTGPAAKPLGTYPVQVVDGEISVSLGVESVAGDRGGPAAPTAQPSAPGPQGPAAGSPSEAADHRRVQAALASVPLFADLDRASIDRLEAFAFRKHFAVQLAHDLDDLRRQLAPGIR